jgi:hypothetical protein
MWAGVAVMMILFVFVVLRGPARPVPLVLVSAEL